MSQSRLSRSMVVNLVHIARGYIMIPEHKLPIPYLAGGLEIGLRKVVPKIFKFYSILLYLMDLPIVLSRRKIIPNTATSY